MLRTTQNAVDSVRKPPVLMMMLPDDQAGWCKQLSQEGYTVLHVTYPSLSRAALVSDFSEALAIICSAHDLEWGLITYGLLKEDIGSMRELSSQAIAGLKACVHHTPSLENVQDILMRDVGGHFIPSLFHLAASQEMLHAALLPFATDASNLGYTLKTSSFNPINVHTYPLVSASPPFPFKMQAPVLDGPKQQSVEDPYVRSATGLAYTRTLELLRRELGPQFDLERLWEKHTYYEFVERDSPKTMGTMVATPYVNHIPTMTGGLGYEDLSRFYKYHFTREDVTPPDTEIITESRTVGADRIIDEMIFKCTHTTEIDWMLPGIKPTGRKLEIAFVGVVAFRGDKLTFEHIYWDQASVLVQLGLINENKLPVAGAETAQKAMNPFGVRRCMPCSCA